MARIRTIKPDFWEDARISRLTRSARLLFLATLNFADDEGLLRWSPSFLLSRAFMYDDDLSQAEVKDMMRELSDNGLVFVYNPGRDDQPVALIVKFRHHQKINRPQPSKFACPPLIDPAVQRMYGERDGWTCMTCKAPVFEGQHTFELLKVPTDKRPSQQVETPSNIGLVHEACCKANREAPSMTALRAAANPVDDHAPVIPISEGTRKSG